MPVEMASSMLFWPQWLKNTSVLLCWSTRACGTKSSMRTCCCMAGSATAYLSFLNDHRKLHIQRRREQVHMSIEQFTLDAKSALHVLVLGQRVHCLSLVVPMTVSRVALR